MKRRDFLQSTLVASTSIAYGSKNPFHFFSNKINSKEPLTFGIVADVHHGMMPDINDRLSTFIEKAIDRDVNFIIQLGDFCHPNKKSLPFLNIWNQFKRNKYHVLGNHDMDLATKEETMDRWGMPGKYYTFDEGDIRFIVLDANYLYQDSQFVDYKNSNFYVDDSIRTYIDMNQIKWLEYQITSSQKPLIILSHQSLWHYQHGIKNRLEVQKILETNTDKIICCLNGHNHIDFHHRQNGINYLDINSMSYQWIGDKYGKPFNNDKLLAEYKWLNHMAPYRDPLYAFATLTNDLTLTVEGVRSTWTTPGPDKRGVPMQMYGNQNSPKISDYIIQN